MLTKKLLLTCLACIFVLAVFTSNSHAWEGPIVVDNENNHSFHKPEIHFGSSGAAYITYRKKNNASRNSDIILATYDGKQFVYENV